MRRSLRIPAQPSSSLACNVSRYVHLCVAHVRHVRLTPSLVCQLISDALFYAAIIFGTCGAVAVTSVIEYGCFGTAGAILTRRLRSESMHALLRQHIGYFDAESNSAGQLVAFLGEKVMLVQALNGERLQIMVRSMCIVVVAIAFILIFGTWQVRMRSGLGDGERMLIGWVVAG